MKYEILQDDFPAELEKQVNSRIQQGYEPLGGVCYTAVELPQGGIYKAYCQAIVKKSLDDKIEEVL